MFGGLDTKMLFVGGKVFLELTEAWQLFWGWWLCRGEPQTGHMDRVPDFDFMLDQFSIPSP